MSDDSGDKAKKDDKGLLTDYVEDVKRTLIAPQPSSPPSSLHKGTGYQEGDDVQPQVLKSLRGFLKATLDNSSNAFITKDGFIESSSPSEGSADPPFQQFTDVISDYEELDYGGPQQAKERFFKSTSDWWGAYGTAGGHGSTKAIGPDGTISKDTIIDFDDPTTIHQLLASVIAGRNPDQRTDGSAGKPSPNSVPPWENPKLNKLREEDPGLNAALNMQQKISSILKYNRFSPGGDSPFIHSKIPTTTLAGGQEAMVLDANKAGTSFETQFVGGEPVETTGGSPFSQQTELGRYSPDAVTVKWDELRAIGIQLMVSATGQLDPDNFDINDASIDKFLADPFPIFGGFGETQNIQMGRGTIGVGDLYAAYIANLLGIPAKTIIPDTEMQVAVNRALPGIFYFRERVDSDRSYGVVNHPGEPYGNTRMISAGMFLIALTLLVFFLVLTFILGAIFSKILGASGQDTLARQPLGSSRRNTRSGDAAFALEYLGIPYTRNNIMSCISRGTALFFGIPPIEETWGWLGVPSADSVIPPTPPSFESVFSRIMNFLYGPGYYVTVMRRVAQDTEQITEHMKKMSNVSMTSSTVGGPTGASPFTSIIEFANLIHVFFDSTTIRWFMRTAQVGDIYLNAMTHWGPLRKNPALLPPQPKNRIMKARLGPGVKGGNQFLSSFAFGTSPSVKILPQSMIFGRARVSSRVNYQLVGEVPGWVWSMGTKLITPQGSNMISPLQIKETQDALDGEYMPFWFQDLRTNELLSFHAFLTSLNENFTPDWSQEEGMGRVDDVMIYKKTGRTITLSFMVAAMHDSHELGQMWAHLDRFIAMIYPQYTAGALYKTKAGAEFRVPFSQIMSAGPVVRMRLGNLFGSNYSKFAVARLFGSDDPAFGQTAMDARKKQLIREMELYLVMVREAYINWIQKRTSACDQLVNPWTDSDWDSEKQRKEQNGIEGDVTTEMIKSAPSRYELINLRAAEMPNQAGYKIDGGMDPYKSGFSLSYVWVIPRSQIKSDLVGTAPENPYPGDSRGDSYSWGTRIGAAPVLKLLTSIGKKQQEYEILSSQLFDLKHKIGDVAKMDENARKKNIKDTQAKLDKLNPPEWDFTIQKARAIAEVLNTNHRYQTSAAQQFDDQLAMEFSGLETAPWRTSIEWLANPENQVSNYKMLGKGWVVPNSLASGLQLLVDNVFIVNDPVQGDANQTQLWYQCELQRFELDSQNTTPAAELAAQRAGINKFNKEYNIFFAHMPGCVDISPMNWSQAVTLTTGPHPKKSVRNGQIDKLKKSQPKFKKLDDFEKDPNAANKLAANFFKSGYEGSGDDAKKSNPVVRSFETINRIGGGIGGLGGVITSLNLEYMDSNWETAPEYKLPMWCNVNIEFSVIHDISPGLDHAGAQRTFIHPGGPASYDYLGGDAKFANMASVDAKTAKTNP